MADNPAGTSGHENPPSEPRSGRACDACHSRKIRCNKESPCAHCSRAGLVCTFTADQSKQKRTRILLTPQYERKLDRMDRRLNDIAEMLEELKNDTATKGGLSRKIVHTPELAPPPAEKSHSCSIGFSNTLPGSQADSTLAAHSEFVHDIIQKTVTTDPSMSHKPEMRKVFDELKDTIKSFGPSGCYSEISYPHASPIQRPSLQGCQMPPIEKVVEVIRNPNYQDIMRISGLSPFFPMNNLADLSLGVYFSQGNCETDFVTVNFGLHYLFQAHASQIMDAEREEWLRFANMCRNNIDTGLSNLPLYLPPTPGTIVALLCGTQTYYSLDISQPHLAWTLIAKASELCQTLGYHHVGTQIQDSKGGTRYQQRLFWLCYTLEKGTSLRLGRSSTIQDWDVTTPLPESTLGDQTSDQGLVPLLNLSVKIARCQGNMQELLCSQTSLSLPDQARHSRIQILETQLVEVGENIRASSENIERLNAGAEVKNSNMIILHSHDIAHLSLLTLLYRVDPRQATSPIFSERCIEKARATLARLHRFLELIEDGHVPATAYNILLYSPIPFIVIFCNSIESHNRSDLACLHDFNTLLMSAAPGSGPVAKMKRLFHALYNVASQYVEIRATQDGAEQTHADAEMDSCLSMLGITASDLVNQQQQGDGLGQTTSHAASDPLDGTGSGIRRESMNPWVWMDNILQPDDFILW